MSGMQRTCSERLYVLSLFSHVITARLRAEGMFDDKNRRGIAERVDAAGGGGG